MNEPYGLEVRPYVGGIVIAYLTIPGVSIRQIIYVKAEEADAIKLMVEMANLGLLVEKDAETARKHLPRMTEKSFMEMVKPPLPPVPVEVPNLIYGVPKDAPTVADRLNSVGHDFSHGGLNCLRCGVHAQRGMLTGCITKAVEARPGELQRILGEADHAFQECVEAGKKIGDSISKAITNKMETDYAEKVKEVRERIDARKKSQPDPTAGLCMAKGGAPFVDKDGKSHHATCTLPAGHAGPHDWETPS